MRSSYKATYRTEWVKCGKATCKRCPHGPYVYAYQRINGRLRKRYVGKPFSSKSDHATTGESMDRREEMLHKNKRSLALAESILMLPKTYTEEEAKKAARKAYLRHHPDRGGALMEFKLANAAWQYIQQIAPWK